MRLKNKAGLNQSELAELESELSQQQTLADVIRWALEQPAARVSPRIVTGVVVQDEFTHDVFLPLGDRLVLVYGAT
jgi:hypothetical protein